MPLYEYECPRNHRTELLRRVAHRDSPAECPNCCILMTRIEISHSHVPPSGVYSYMPNLGSARDFERRQNALESGQRVIKREANDG